jgi:diguanylate cyclase (GGDEF)-like protein/PAS domain S-box-containing protein
MLMRKIGLLTLAYVVSGWLGLQVPYAGSHITLIWLPTGIAVAALLRWGTGVWPGIALGALLVNLTIAPSWWLASAIAAGNTLAPLLTAYGLKRVGFNSDFERQKDVAFFITAAAVGMAVSASGGVLSLYLAGLMPLDALSAAWLSWWMGDSVGVLLAAPLLLTIGRPACGSPGLSKKEVMAWSLLSGAIIWMTFIYDYPEFGRTPPLAFMTLPLLTWAALRFGPSGAALAGLVFSMAAAGATANGHGLFVTTDMHLSLFLVWTYMATVVLTCLFIIALQAERRQIEAKLRIAATAFESQESILVTDASGMIMQVNRAFTESTGYSAAEAVGQKPNLLKSGRHDAAFYQQMWETIKRTGGWKGEIWDRRRNGEIYPKWLTISAVKDANGQVSHYVGTHFDITERKQAEERIKALAFFDQLTGLPNRTLLLDRLNQATGTRSEAHGALLFIDLDHFKILNDTLGHDMGDLLLKHVAQRLLKGVREGDTVARLGGDEFVVLLANLHENLPEAALGTEIVAKKLLAALNQPYDLDKVIHHCSASMGATLFHGKAASIDELMKQADLAMYQSKATGRNALRFFDPDMESAAKARARLEADLRQAVSEGQFVLHFQPQILAPQQLTGAEALLRWQHPARGMVSPAEFIPLAEETGLILPIGLWVLESACSRLARWAADPAMASLNIAVNVSALQFHQPDFVDQVISVVKQRGANPQRLKLELTESLLVNDVDQIVAKMTVLKTFGIGFSLDDFGTGYSSLSYLKRLPLDQLKIDQSFVRDVLTDPNDAVIARTIVALAQSLGLGVIAEGVETDEQRSFLANAGCAAYQGYFFSRPLPIEDFEAFARNT